MACDPVLVDSPGLPSVVQKMETMPKRPLRTHVATARARTHACSHRKRCDVFAPDLILSWFRVRRFGAGASRRDRTGNPGRDNARASGLEFVQVISSAVCSGGKRSPTCIPSSTSPRDGTRK